MNSNMSKAQWIEEGEKNTNYFLNLEKRNYNSACLKKLITKEGKEITDLEEIIQKQKNFYQKLYTSQYQNNANTLKTENKFLNNIDIQKLDNIDMLCDEQLTLKEKVLNNLANNQSPGIEGFSTNFYKFFWIDLNYLLYESYLYSFEHNLLTNEQRIGISNLIPKKDKDLQK